MGLGEFQTHRAWCGDRRGSRCQWRRLGLAFWLVLGVELGLSLGPALREAWDWLMVRHLDLC
jgi:hypothetical protein